MIKMMFNKQLIVRKIFYILILFSIYGNAQNYMSRPNPIRQPIEQGGDLYLAQTVLIEKQRRYDVNKVKLDECIVENLKGLGLLSKFDAKVPYEEFQRVEKMYFQLVRNILSNNYDLSSSNTLKFLMDKISNYPFKLSCQEWGVDCEYVQK